MDIPKTPTDGPDAIAQALLQTAQSVHQICIEPEDEAEGLANLELAAVMFKQLEEVQLSDDQIDLAPVFSPSGPQQT